jgi:hypothetical protein
MKQAHNPQRLYLYKAIDENNEVMAETLFFNLDDAIEQLKIDEKDYVRHLNLGYTPLFQTKIKLSKFIISLPTPKQLRHLTKRGVKIY